MICLNSIVLTACKDILDEIEEDGELHENTQEIIGVSFTIDITEVNLEKEELYLRNYYGERYEKRYEDEKFHYEQIKYSLFHKIKEIKYFFNQDIENRKIVVFSQDCISLAQYIKRDEGTGLLVYMRSSDVKELLPLDILNLMRILRELNQTFCPGEDLQEVLFVWIGSAHYYIDGGRE